MISQKNSPPGKCAFLMMLFHLLIVTFTRCFFLLRSIPITSFFHQVSAWLPWRICQPVPKHFVLCVAISLNSTQCVSSLLYEPVSTQISLWKWSLFDDKTSSASEYKWMIQQPNNFHRFLSCYKPFRISANFIWTGISVEVLRKLKYDRLL